MCDVGVGGERTVIDCVIVCRRRGEEGRGEREEEWRVRGGCQGGGGKQCNDEFPVVQTSTIYCINH